MNKKQLTTRKLCSMAVIVCGVLFLGSCAKDGYDDKERFDSGVNNTQVEAVKADGITITASADGKTQTITWPVVMGAGGYRVSLIDTGNPDEPIINDSIVDGCSVTAARAEDVNYKLSVLTLGNKGKGNGDASETVVKEFSTFTPTFKTIPAGSNLNEWFAANTFPEETKEENLNFDLEAGGEYTLSGTLDDSAYIHQNNPRDMLLQQVKNSTNLKIYKDEGYNFRYIYNSKKEKGSKLFDETFKPKDYE